MVDIIWPVPPKHSCNTSSPIQYSIFSPANMKVVVSPDFAKSALLSALKESKETLHVAIYQITDDTLCKTLKELSDTGVKVKVVL